jgi:hypothetical protein
VRGRQKQVSRAPLIHGKTGTMSYNFVGKKWKQKDLSCSRKEGREGVVGFA